MMIFTNTDKQQEFTDPINAKKTSIPASVDPKPSTFSSNMMDFDA
jgi:hypothetical protein